MPYRTVDLLERFIRKSSSACPIIIVGEQCPEETILYYFRCCGDLNTSCCFRLQEWVLALLVIMFVLFIASLVINFIRCLFCPG
ncbi:Protein SUP-1 [Dirofilaria immitis]